MASSGGQRMAAFLLASVFLLTSVGATAYVILQINEGDGVLVSDNDDLATDAQRQAEAQAAANTLDPPCRAGVFDPVDPRPAPTVTTNDGAITELQTIDVREGDGEEVQPGDCVATLYYGTLASNGTNFDGNYDTGAPLEFSLAGGVIQGWVEGIPGMKVGGVRRILIPAAQAYGEQAQGDIIPANADLIFEVEVISTRR